MNRNSFLKTLLGATTMITMDGFAHLVDAAARAGEDNRVGEFATFGAIHLNITNLKKSIAFYTKIAGMKLRVSDDKVAELGTERNTLVVLHQTAERKFQKGYSGLYHFAIHAPTEAEFASMINRLNVNRHPYSPVDHTASKSIYLDDPDGINVEFTLETPERLKRVITTRGIVMEGTDGVMRGPSERLDVNEILKSLTDKKVDKVLHSGTYLGHVHLYANNVVESNTFYKSMGYIEANYLPQYMFADLGAGGAYAHRMVMNEWHGKNKPLAPEGSAGMSHFQIHYKSKKKLCTALAALGVHEEKDGGFWLSDPTGNKILFTYDS